MFCLIPILQVGNRGRRRLKSDLLNSTQEIPHETTDHKPQIFQASSSIITKPSSITKLFSFWFSLVVFICTKTFMLLQSWPPDFFFSVQKLIYNYILCLMSHLRSKLALFQRKVVKLQAG